MYKTILFITSILTLLSLIVVSFFWSPSAQTSKWHYIVQCYYSPRTLLKESVDFLSIEENYTGTWLDWSKDGKIIYETEVLNGRQNGKRIDKRYNTLISLGRYDKKNRFTGFRFDDSFRDNIDKARSPIMFDFSFAFFESEEFNFFNEWGSYFEQDKKQYTIYARGRAFESLECYDKNGDVIFSLNGGEAEIRKGFYDLLPEVLFRYLVHRDEERLDVLNKIAEAMCRYDMLDIIVLPSCSMALLQESDEILVENGTHMADKWVLTEKLKEGEIEFKVGWTLSHGKFSATVYTQEKIYGPWVYSRH